MNRHIRPRMIIMAVAVSLTLTACGTKQARLVATNLKEGAPVAKTAIVSLQVAAKSQTEAHKATRDKLREVITSLHNAKVVEFKSRLTALENKLDSILLAEELKAIGEATAKAREIEADFGNQITAGLGELRGVVVGFREEARRLATIANKPENDQNMVVQREAAVFNQRYAAALVIYRELQLAAWADWRTKRDAAFDKFKPDLMVASAAERAKRMVSIEAIRTSLDSHTCCTLDLGPEPTVEDANYTKLAEWVGDVGEAGAELERYFDQPKLLPKAFVGSLFDNLKGSIPFFGEATGETKDLKTGVDELLAVTGLDKIKGRIDEAKKDGKLTPSGVFRLLIDGFKANLKRDATAVEEEGAKAAAKEVSEAQSKS